MQQVEKVLESHIIISAEMNDEIVKLQEQLKPSRCVIFVEDVFKIEHSKLVTHEAYLSESSDKYIIIGAIEFTDVAQNALLKLLEEPPRNIKFIIITPTKSNLLPTVRSRLPLYTSKSVQEIKVLDLNLAKADYKNIFEFLKENVRIKKKDAKELVEAIFYRATVIDKLLLSQRQLDNFDKAYRLIDLNSRPQSVLAMLLMSFSREY